MSAASEGSGEVAVGNYRMGEGESLLHSSVELDTSVPCGSMGGVNVPYELSNVAYETCKWSAEDATWVLFAVYNKIGEKGDK